MYWKCLPFYYRACVKYLGENLRAQITVLRFKKEKSGLSFLGLKLVCFGTFAAKQQKTFLKMGLFRTKTHNFMIFLVKTQRVETKHPFYRKGVSFLAATMFPTPQEGNSLFVDRVFSTSRNCVLSTGREFTFWLQLYFPLHRKETHFLWKECFLPLEIVSFLQEGSFLFGCNYVSHIAFCGQSVYLKKLSPFCRKGVYFLAATVFLSS